MRHYYVDESGDGVLFDKHGNPLVGTPGCSNHFILGYTYIENPSEVANALTALRINLLNDPFLAHLPSMQATEKKTYTSFHAKNDCPEVRYQVFRLLRELEGLHFHAFVMNMHGVLKFEQARRIANPKHLYHPNRLYDYTVDSLFQDKLHKDQDFHIYFAQRGHSDRTKALEQALDSARRKFAHKAGIANLANLQVTCESPKKVVELQVTDYFLWALQRYYERGDKGFIQGLWNSVSLVCYDDYREYPRSKTNFHKKRPLP